MSVMTPTRIVIKTSVNVRPDIDLETTPAVTILHFLVEVVVVVVVGSSFNSTNILHCVSIKFLLLHSS